MAPYFNQRILQSTIQNTVLSWARSDNLLLAIADPEWKAPAGVVIVPEKSAKRVSTRFQRSSQRDAPWSELSLHCRPNPLLLFILDGEADIRVGRILEEPKHRSKTRNYEVSVYSLPAHSCLIVPADVAHSDGSTPHWEREDIANSHSRILWLQILPTGAIVHICQSQGELHTHTTSIFVRDLQLLPLMHFMLERARQSKQSEPMLSSFLLTLLLCFEQSQKFSLLSGGDVPELIPSVEQGQNATHTPHDSQSEIFERACLYIGSHLTDTLTPTQIARHVHISVSQLSRIFNSQLDMPVMKYVTGRRVEEAKSLLLRTSLTTQEVGEICGYPHRTHFSRVFKEQLGCSPLAFRREATTRNREKSS